MQGLDDPKLIFQCLPVSLAGRTFNLASNAERVPGDASLKRLKLGASFGGGEDSPARSLIIAARANSKRLSSTIGRDLAVHESPVSVERSLIFAARANSKRLSSTMGEA